MRFAIKFGVSCAWTIALPKPQIAEVLHRRHVRRIRVWRSNNLKQPHIAWRIEEVRAEPVASQLHRHTFDDLVDRQTARIARHNRVRMPMLQHLVQQRPLDLHILCYDFDDPVAVRDQRKIIVKVSDRNQACIVRRIKRRRLRLLQPIKRSENDLVALLLRRSGVGSRWNDVEHHHWKTRVSDVRRNARAHSSSSEDGYFFDLSMTGRGPGRGCGGGAGGHRAGSGGLFTRTMRSILNDHSFRQVNAGSIFQTADSKTATTRRVQLWVS